VKAAKIGILDGIGNTLAGSTQPVAQIISEYVQDMGGTPMSSVVGRGFKTSPFWAAFANGAFTHCMDYEIQGTPSTHGTSSILPAALALAETVAGASGKDVIEAYAIGWDVQQRIITASTSAGADLRGFHPPGVYGPLGAAAAAAKIFKFNKDEVRMVLGIAASRTGALFANNGTMTKSTHPGNAARVATEAALLVRKGFTSNASIFEEPRGYIASLFGGLFSWERMLEETGTKFHLVDPGFNIKRYPAELGMQPVLNVMSDLRDKYGLRLADVERVEIGLSRDPGYDSRPRPKSGLDGKFSFEYCAVVPLIDNPVGIDSFSDETCFSAPMQEALGKVSLHRNPEPGRGVAATVVLKDGRVVTGECLYYRGSIRNPMTRDEHLVKYVDCAKRVLSPGDVDHLRALIESLEELKDVRELMAFVNRPPVSKD
jgi:2-methylcitrate dehydratase PrpD